AWQRDLPFVGLRHRLRAAEDRRRQRRCGGVFQSQHAEPLQHFGAGGRLFVRILQQHSDGHEIRDRRGGAGGRHSGGLPRDIAIRDSQGRVPNVEPAGDCEREALSAGTGQFVLLQREEVNLWGSTPVLPPTSTSACSCLDMVARRAGPGGPAQTWRSAPQILAIHTALLCLSMCADAAVDDGWTQFRGPAAGVAEDAALPDTWGPTTNVVWKLDIPGRGWSSPVVAGDRIFLTSVIATQPEEPPKKGLYFGGNREAPPADEHRWMVYCVDWKTGKLLWEREVHRGKAPARHLKNSYASETPVTDGERVYAYFGSVGVFCLDRDGKPVWSQPLGPFRMRYGWGAASSPVLHQGRLYIVNDNEDQSFLEALDAKTGKQIWRVARDEGSNWATPFVWESGKRTEIVTAGTRRVRRHQPEGRRDQQRIRGVVSAPGRSLQSVAAGLRRLLLHLDGLRLSDLPRRAHRKRSLRQAAHQRGGRGLHRVALGVQR